MIEVITAGTIRELVGKANSMNLKKESIITLLKESNQYILMYYGDNV